MPMVTANLKLVKMVEEELKITETYNDKAQERTKRSKFLSKIFKKKSRLEVQEVFLVSVVSLELLMTTTLRNLAELSSLSVLKVLG